MESPADKSFLQTEREGMQDTSMIKPAMGWFGMPPHSVQNSVGEGISRLHVDRDACKGSTDTPDREGRLRERRRPRNSVMGSRKTRLIVRSDAEISAKARTSEASAEESMSVI